MDKLKTLKSLVAKASDENAREDLQMQKEIHGYVSKYIASDPSFTKFVPTLDILIYTIKSIMKPDLYVDAIPDLLDLLTTVEFYRDRIVHSADNALTWNRYYQNDPSVLKLTSDEVETLNQIQTKAGAWRNLYLEICCGFSRYHLYHLWASDLPSVTTFLIRFNEYFPGLLSNLRSRRLLHLKLSADDKASLEKAARHCCDIIFRVSSSDVRPDQSSLLEDFHHADPLSSPLNLQEVLYKYLRHVEMHASALHELFDQLDTQ